MSEQEKIDLDWELEIRMNILREQCFLLGDHPDMNIAWAHMIKMSDLVKEFAIKYWWWQMRHFRKEIILFDKPKSMNKKLKQFNEKCNGCIDHLTKYMYCEKCPVMIQISKYNHKNIVKIESDNLKGIIALYTYKKGEPKWIAGTSWQTIWDLTHDNKIKFPFRDSLRWREQMKYHRRDIND